MALTITNLSDAAKQAVIDRATNAGVSSPADILNILLAKLVDTEVIVNVAESLTLLPAHNKKVLVVESGAATVITWNDDSNPLPVGFNCLVIKNTAESVSFAIVGDVTLSSINDNVTMENLNGAVTFLTASATLGFIFGDLYTP